MKCVASAVQDGAVTDNVAEQALDVAAMVVADMDEASRSEQVTNIVDATVDVFRGVARHLSAESAARNGNGTQGERLRRKLDQASASSELKVITTKKDANLTRTLKAGADNLCNSLTSTSAPGAPAIGSSSPDLSFKCQKIEQRPRSTGPSGSTTQARGLHQHTHTPLGS